MPRKLKIRAPRPAAIRKKINTAVKKGVRAQMTRVKAAVKKGAPSVSINGDTVKLY